MLTGHATLLPEGRTPKFIALFLTKAVQKQLKYHIYERDIDLELDPNPKMNLYYKFKIPPQSSINQTLEANICCLNFPSQEIKHDF